MLCADRPNNVDRPTVGGAIAISRYLSGFSLCSRGQRSEGPAIAFSAFYGGFLRTKSPSAEPFSAFSAFSAVASTLALFDLGFPNDQRFFSKQCRRPATALRWPNRQPQEFLNKNF